MQAAVFYGPQQELRLEEVELDAPCEHEVLVRTVASGVCYSDLHFVEGHYTIPAPAVLGHEAAGIVEAVGSAVMDVALGDRVIACLSVFCERCMSGEPFLC